jgi:diguanylate cyclase (GGDEF)-like protein
LEELRQHKLELELRVQDRTRDLKEANHQLEQKNLMLEKLALTDPLTGLPNRRAMDGLAESELRRLARYPSSLAMGLIDADNFRQINHRYLHPGGDLVLVELGKLLSASLRTVDTVGRIGGEEFLVVAPETDWEGACVLGERIRSAVADSRIRYKNELIEITVSVGFAVVEPGVSASYEQMKYLAAAALATAKAMGRNRCIIHTLGQAVEQVG